MTTACCPPEGTRFDPSTSPAVAAATAAGLTALPDRAALAARIAPITGEARDRMIQATVTAVQSILDLLHAVTTQPGDNPPSAPGNRDPNGHRWLPGPVARALLHTARTALREAQAHYRAGRPLDDQQAALLTVLLDVPIMRVFAAQHTTGEAWETDMWIDLLRRAESAFTAGPAILLALAALRTGDGTLAAIATQRAIDADPDDPLAAQLADALGAGLDPATITALLTGE